MALLRTNIDQYVTASLTASANVAYAHNLAVAPHAVFVRHAGTVAAAYPHIRVAIGAVSNTIYNAGQGESGPLEVTSIIFHSMIQ